MTETIAPTEIARLDPSGPPGPAAPLPDPLLAWALGAFHTALFVFLAVFLVYRGGGLGNLLGGLNTLIGSGLFALLWATTGWTTRRAAGKVGASPAAGVSWNLLGGGGMWGAVNATLFLGVFLVPLAVFAVVVDFRQVAADLGGFLIFLLAALGVAGFVGFLAGLTLSLLDVALLLIATRLLPDPASPPPPAMD